MIDNTPLTTSDGEASGESEKRFPQRISCLQLVVGLVVFIALLPFLIPFGYCHDWWLKSSPWAYYWWICDCSPEFERSLYPEQIEVVVPACENPGLASLSADGRYMMVPTKLFKEPMYLLDLATGDKRLWTYPQKPRAEKESFVTETIIHALDRQIKDTVYLDITDGYVIPSTPIAIRDRSESFTLPEEALQALQNAERVVIRERNSRVLAFSKKPCHTSCEIHFFGYAPIPAEQMKAILSENGIDYEIGRYCWWKTGCPSADGRFIDGWGRIYRKDDLSKPIVSLGHTPPFMSAGDTLGWAHDDSGLYIKLAEPYIIDGGDYAFPSYFRLPMPIIKLKVPEEYLLATPTPVP